MRLPLALSIIFGMLWVTGLYLESLGPVPTACDEYKEMREINKDTNGEFGWDEYAVKGCDYE